MDISKFTSASPGRLIGIPIPKGEHAFIPNSLDANWHLPESLIEPLLAAQQALGTLDGAGRHMPNVELLMRPLRHREAIKSSSLEGTYASPEELALYEMDPRDPKSERDPANAWREVFNYSEALVLGQTLLEEIPLSIRWIRELHKRLLRGVRGADKRPGEIRNTQVQIGSDARFVPPPPQELNTCLGDFEIYLNTNSKVPGLVRCFMAHYQFEAIHPFHDGNGRVGRLLLALMFWTVMGLEKPWLYISAYFDQYRDEYIDCLFNVSAKGDYESWLRFCLRGVSVVCEDSLSRMDSLIELRAEFCERITAASGNARQIALVDHLFETPVITVPQVAKIYDVTYPTARTDIDRFIELGILKQSPLERRPTYYLASEIINVAHG
jgi:Fic family protein